MAQVGGKTIVGEEKIQMTKLNGSLKKLWLEPSGTANPKALTAIKAADAIIIGPGNLYASLVPNLLVQGLADAIRKSKAEKIFICGLMTKLEHTPDFDVMKYTAEIEKYLGAEVDTVIFNNKEPDAELLKRYAREGDTPTAWRDVPKRSTKFVGSNLLSKHTQAVTKVGTPAMESSLVRHDSAKLAKAITKVLGVTLPV
jgi:uncharacterized cofD-like protein